MRLFSVWCCCFYLFSSEFRPFILFNKQVVLNVSDSAATPCDEGDLSSLEWKAEKEKELKREKRRKEIKEEKKKQIDRGQIPIDLVKVLVKYLAFRPVYIAHNNCISWYNSVGQQWW